MHLGQSEGEREKSDERFNGNYTINFLAQREKSLHKKVFLSGLL